MRWTFDRKNSRERWRNRKYQWRLWFAWRPVEVDLADHTWVWFSLIERIRVKDSECGDFWDYREIGKETRVFFRYPR